MNTKLRRTIRASRKTGCERTGAASVEFAFVFPLILTFFLGMIVMTQAFVMRDTAQQAAYEGARRALVLNTTPEDAEDAVMEFAEIMRLKGVQVAVNPSVFNESTNRVTVTVSIPYSANAWVGSGFMPEDWATSATISLNRFTH